MLKGYKVAQYRDNQLTTNRKSNSFLETETQADFRAPKDSEELEVLRQGVLSEQKNNTGLAWIGFVGVAPGAPGGEKTSLILKRGSLKQTIRFRP